MNVSHIIVNDFGKYKFDDVFFLYKVLQTLLLAFSIKYNKNFP